MNRKTMTRAMRKTAPHLAKAAGPVLLRAVGRAPKSPMLRAASAASSLVLRRRRRHASPVMRAAAGLGAAALAVPLGLWLGRKLRGGEQQVES